MTAVLSDNRLGSNLREILECDDLLPGDAPSYATAKKIWLFHPLGLKMVESPIRLAQSQEREISISRGPEELLVEHFQKAWKELDMSAQLYSVKAQSRVYGLAGIGVGERGRDQGEPIDLKSIYKSDLYFNVFDPLNIPGLIVNQDPNSPDFLKPRDVVVQGKLWHRSRVRVLQNEFPVYIAWTDSSYSYSGRSCFQRGLYPLKSFLQTMITDDLVSRKAGLLVARMQQPGSIVDRIQSAMYSVKRVLLRQAKTGDVIGIGVDESIESVNMRNVDGSMRESRSNIIKNIATSDDMPAKLLTAESYVEGFGEGTQDAYAVAQYIDRFRTGMDGDYAWADAIVQRRAWSPEFYETVQKRYPDDYGRVEYETAFQEWRNSFKTTWPSLVKEEPSKAIEVDKSEVEGAIAGIQVLSPLLQDSPRNQVALVKWFADAVNSRKNMLQGTFLQIDFDELEADLGEVAEQRREMATMGGPPGGELAEEEGAARPRHPFASTDSAGEVVRLVRDAVARAGDKKQRYVRYARGGGFVVGER